MRSSSGGSARTCDWYYRYLATQVYERRDMQFWSFHQAKLQEVGYPLSKLRLTVEVASYTLDLLLNPQITFQRLVSRIRRAHSGAPSAG